VGRACACYECRADGTNHFSKRDGGIEGNGTLILEKKQGRRWEKKEKGTGLKTRHYIKRLGRLYFRLIEV